MIKRLSILFFAMAFVFTAIAQDKVTPLSKLSKNVIDDGEVTSNTATSLNKPNGTAVLISKMWNAYSTQASNTNQIYYDTYSNLAAVIHRIDRTGVGSGRIVYNVSDDAGLSWSPQIGPINDLNTNGRHPNIILSNPTQSSDPGGVSALFAYYQVGASGGFDIGVWGGDVLGNGTPVTFAEADKWSVGDEAFTNNRGHGFFVNDLSVTLGGVVQKLQKTTDGGATWSESDFGLGTDYFNETWNGTKGDISSAGTGFVIVEAKPAGIDDFRFGWKSTADDGDTWDANWTWENPYTASYLGGALGDSVHALNFEVDFIVQGASNPFFVGTFVDTLGGTATGIYVISNTGSGWQAELMRLVNATSLDLAGGLQTLNEVEFARSENGSILALKYCDLPTATDVNYDMFVRWFDGSSWSAEENITNTPSVNEVYSQTAPRLNFNGTDTYKLMSMYTLFGADDLAEAELYFVDDVNFITTSVGEDPSLVNNFKLEQNYPNPFNPSTKIKYSVAERSNVSIKVFDMLGKEVTTLVNTSKEAGSYEVSFDASNLASGLYVYTINAGNFTSSKKMMLLK
jgi:hypothetical protein